jgi:hypothetical protein
VTTSVRLQGGTMLRRILVLAAVFACLSTAQEFRSTTLTKTFTIKERVKVQFRGESFNLCNKPLFGTPTLTATTSNFGTIGTQTNNPRYIQFGLRLTY